MCCQVLSLHSDMHEHISVKLATVSQYFFFFVLVDSCEQHMGVHVIMCSAGNA